MRNIFLLLSMIFFGVWTAKAQNTLSGTVLSKDGEIGIPVTVSIPKLDRKTGADDAGNYTIENVPNGTFTVVYSMVGYRTYSEKINFHSGETIHKDVFLQETAVEIEEVIVSTVFHMLQSENVMKVERMSVADMKDKGAETLASGLNNIAGVNVISTGQGIGKPVIRGLSSNRVLTYTQGVRLENQQFGEEHGLGINESGIESVEVIKGPASLLYGSDALGGVLYLNPEKFAAPGETHADLNSTYFSSSQGTATDIGIQHSGDKLRFLLRGAYSSHADYRTGADYKVTNSRFNEKDIKTGVRYGSNHIISALRYNYNRSDLGIPEEIGEQISSRKPMLPYQTTDNHILSLDNTFHLSRSKITAKVGYTANDRREYEEEHEHGEEHEHSEDEHEASNGVLPSLRMQLNTFNYDVKYHFPSGKKLETIVGIQGMYQDNKNFGEEVLIPDAITHDFGVFATSHYHLEKIDFQAGLRFDTREVDVKETWNAHDNEWMEAANKKFNSFNAAVGMKWDIGNDFVSRINMATGYRAPNLAEMTSDGYHHGSFRYEIGSLDLVHEQNIQTDIALEYKRTNLDIFANGFYNKVNDYIFLEPSGTIADGHPVYHFKQEDAKLYGGEFSFHIHPASLSWLHFESGFEMVVGMRQDGEYLPFIPAHNLSHLLQINLNDRSFMTKPTAFVELKTHFAQNKVSEFEDTSKGYTLLNAGINSDIRFRHQVINIGVTGTNLTNKSYVSHLSRLKNYSIYDTGRSIQVSLRFRI